MPPAVRNPTSLRCGAQVQEVSTGSDGSQKVLSKEPGNKK